MFRPGQSGNLRGRPRGAVNRKEFRAIVGEPELEALVRRLTEAALNGDMKAASIILDRCYPTLRAVDVQAQVNLDKVPTPVYKIVRG